MAEETEGVIKFKVKFRRTHPLSEDLVQEINFWRQILFGAHLIGQNPRRYDGWAYGNISRRMPPYKSPRHKRQFIVSGTQTSGYRELKARHYSVVTECYPSDNWIRARGPIAPSSEAMTHGMIYDLDSQLRWVMHVHSPEIWQQARSLRLPLTNSAAAYGTPEMAGEVARLFGIPQFKSKSILVMGGHKDGVISFGKTAEEAGLILLNTLAAALAL